MACEQLKAKYDALEAQVKTLTNELLKNPKADQAPILAQLKKVSAEAFAANQQLAACLAANAPPPPTAAPAQILDILNIVSADTIAQAETALAQFLASIGSKTFPVDVPSEWIQPLATDTEYDDDPIGVTGWAVNPRLVDGDFPFSHPFQNSITNTPFDYEFSMCLDRPTANPTEFDYRLTLGNKAPNPSPDPNDERVKDEAFATNLKLDFPLGLLGVEMDGANIPRDFISNVQSGNRVAVFGRWIVDTGHALATQSGAQVPRAEIHPPLIMAAASVTASDTTRALFTSRAYMVADTFTTDQSTIYDDSAGDDGTFFKHILNEVIKVNANIFGIPIDSLLVEAHPKIKSYPFRGVHLLHFLIRPPALSTRLGQILQPHHIEVSFNFTVRSGCAVEVTSSAADTVDVWVVMNQAGYKPPQLPANPGRRWSRDELAALNSGAGSDYLDAEIVSAALQVLRVNPIGAVVVEGILSRGIQSDAYASSNDAVQLLSTQGAVNNVPATSIPANTGIHTNDNQPFPVYGWLEAKWVQNEVVNQPIAAAQNIQDASRANVQPLDSSQPKEK